MCVLFLMEWFTQVEWWHSRIYSEWTKLRDLNRLEWNRPALPRVTELFHRLATGDKDDYQSCCVRMWQRFRSGQTVTSHFPPRSFSCFEEHNKVGEERILKETLEHFWSVNKDFPVYQPRVAGKPEVLSLTHSLTRLSSQWVRKTITQL